MKTLKSIVTLILLTSVITVWAAEQQELKPPKMPKSFDTMKQFLGTWQGTANMHGKEMEVKSVYKLTSGGTAIEQISMAGTPMEMVTIYHKDGDSLGMTHYCSMGNQPYMSLVEAKNNKVQFKIEKNKGISSDKEPHMRALTLKLSDKNTMSEEWVFYQGGKEENRTVFNLKRVDI